MTVIPFPDDAQTWRDLGIDTRGKHSGQIKTLCPKCSHTRRHRKDLCLSVNLDTLGYTCHHCGWRGWLKTGEESPSRPRYTPPSEESYITPLPARKVKTIDEWARAFLMKRGLSEATIDAANVIGARIHMPQTGRDEDVIVFPFTREGEIVNNKYYQPTVVDGVPDKNCRQEKGAERIWYGLDWCKDADQVIVVEGEIDALSLREVGYEAVLSVPDGAPNPSAKDYVRKFSFFDGARDIFTHAAIVIVATDNDGPGEVLANEIARRVGKDKCFRVLFPDGCKDANDVLTKHGRDRLQQCIQSAMPWPVEGVINPQTLFRGVMLFRDGKMAQGADTGFPTLNQLYRPALGQMTVIIGVPQHGKSQFIDQLMLNLIRHNQWTFGVFSPEYYPPELHVSHLLQKLYHKPIADITETEIQKALVWMDRHVQLIAPDIPTLREIVERTSILVQERGTSALVIDPWTELVEEGENTQKFIKTGLTELGRLKRAHDMHVFVTVHPRKLTEDRDFDGMTKMPKPGGYDAADSAHFYNKADNFIVIWRDVDREGAPIEVSVIKARFRERARRGTMLLNYDPVTQELTDGGMARG